MPSRKVEVLLLTGSESGISSLQGFLEQRGCHCSVVPHAKALDLPELTSFDLILSTTPLKQMEPLVRKLNGARCKIFYEFAVEDGCWWVPLDGETRKSLGGPALRNNEFAEFLDRSLKEIQKAEDGACCTTGRKSETRNVRPGEVKMASVR
jgi:hypothetical protein